MKREIIKIDEDKCNGCGKCIPSCHEGALQIIDNKAVLISDLLCDGLGACLGQCPEDALNIEEREAEAYNETKVMEKMLRIGKNVVIAHLKHLKDHNETAFLKEGVRYLWQHENELDFHPSEVIEEVHQLPTVSKSFPFQPMQSHPKKQQACPGLASREIQIENTVDHPQPEQKSELSQWPVQLHLINPVAGFFHNADLLIAADCAAYAAGNFHARFLKNKKLAIACPKLDQGREIYIEKIRQLIDSSKVNTISVVRMEVPCCSGLLDILKNAAGQTSRNIPVKEIVLSADGNILSEEWVPMEFLRN